MKSFPIEIDSNKIIVAFSKVTAISPIYWVNQEGRIRKEKTTDTTYNGVYYALDAMMPPLPLRNFPRETTRDRFKRLGIKPDVWTARVTFQLTANHSLTYTGEQAMKLEAAYRAWLLNQPKKKKCNRRNNQRELPIKV